jgi:hypothetical protein
MLGKPLLFFSSYAPLFGLLAIRFQQSWLWISCIILAGLGVGSLVLLLRLAGRSSPGPHLLASARDAGSESLLIKDFMPLLPVSADLAGCGRRSSAGWAAGRFRSGRVSWS